MARFGFDLYGSGFYGAPVFIEFDASPVDAVAVDYGTLLVSWRTPTGNWDRLRLVRDSFGYAPTPDSGAILIDAGKAEPVVQYLDTDELLRPERFYYYSLFVRATIDGLWRRSGDTTGLMTKDWGYGPRLYSLTPTVFRDKDYEQTPFRADAQGVLERFLLLFGFALDSVRTEYETLKHVNDPTKVAGGLLPVMAKQWGFGFEAELGMRLSRIQLRNAVHLYKLKGTRLGVEGAVSVLTGWAPIVDSGRNRLLDQNEGSFEQGLGTWTSGVGAPLLSRRNVSTAPVIAGPVTLPAGSSTGDVGSGNWLLELIAGGAGDQSLVQTANAQYFSAPVTPGNQYTFSAYFRPDTSARSVQVRLYWFDRNGTAVGSITGGVAAEIADNWVRASVTAVAPANATGAFGELLILGAGANERHWIDALQLEEGPGLTPYESPRDVRITLLAERVNRIPNPSFEVGITGWEAVSVDNATVSRSTTVGKFGTSSLQLKAVAAGAMQARPAFIPVTEGSYTFSMYIRAGNTPRNVSAHLAWYNANGQLLTSIDGASTVEPSSFDFIRVSVTGVAPPLARTVRARVVVLGALANETHLLDGALLERGSALQEYFDGSTRSDSGEYMWEAAAHNSPTHFYSRRLIKNFRLNQRLKDFLPAAATYTLLYARGTDYESTPGLIPGLRSWLQADTIPLSDGARVGTWGDDSGRGNSGTQAALASQPRKVDDALNGHAVVRFDGISDFFTLPNFLTGLIAGEVFVVIKSRLDPPTNADSSGFWDLGSSAGSSHYPFTSGSVYDEFGTSAIKISSDPAFSLAAWHLYNARSAASAWSNHIDGVQLFSTTDNTVGWSTSPRLGQSNGTSTQYFDGDIAEVLIYDNVLSADSRAKIHGYLARKYGLSVA